MGCSKTGASRVQQDARNQRSRVNSASEPGIVHEMDGNSIRDRLDEETLAVLNDDQRAQWRKRTGPACDTIPKRIPGMSLTF
jgi:hypothetical protein